MYETPILLIVFNKTTETQRTFNAVKSVKPKNLYIAFDGPRTGNSDDITKCHFIQSWILEEIDWECNYKTLIHKTNQGCGLGPYTSITWFFNNVEEGIILEDDCVANQSFFNFCKENLSVYKNNPLISIISGNNFLNGQLIDNSDYYFSIFPSTWGWATWRRTWFDFQMNLGNLSKKNKRDLIEYIFKEKELNKWWLNKINWILKNKPTDMWDFQFHIHCMKKKQLAIIPRVNLVSNIGHGDIGTHTRNSNSAIANLPTYELNSPLKHPINICRNYCADYQTQKLIFGIQKESTGWEKIKKVLSKIQNCFEETINNHN